MSHRRCRVSDPLKSVILSKPNLFRRCRRTSNYFSLPFSRSQTPFGNVFLLPAKFHFALIGWPATTRVRALSGWPQATGGSHKISTLQIRHPERSQQAESKDQLPVNIRFAQ